MVTEISRCAITMSTHKNNNNSSCICRNKKRAYSSEYNCCSNIDIENTPENINGARKAWRNVYHCIRHSKPRKNCNQMLLNSQAFQQKTKIILNTIFIVLYEHGYERAQRQIYFKSTYALPTSSEQQYPPYHNQCRRLWKRVRTIGIHGRASGARWWIK